MGAVGGREVEGWGVEGRGNIMCDCGDFGDVLVCGGGVTLGG